MTMDTSVSLVALSALTLLLAFHLRERWLSDRTAEFVELAPLLEKLENEALAVTEDEDSKTRFASHFDLMVHIYLSSAFSGAGARSLLERRLHTVLREVATKGFDPVTVFERDKYALSQTFLSILPSWEKKSVRHR